MVCNEKASAREIELLDQQIAGFGRRSTPFSKGGDAPPPVDRADTAKVDKINREVANIHKIADDLVQKITQLAKDSDDHKRHHLIEWAKNGCPADDDDEDYTGIQLGDALENALRTRKEAVDAVRARLLSRVPLIEETSHSEAVEGLSDDQLLALAKQAIAAKK